MDSDNSNRLFLLDAYALIYRAYYALIRAPRITSKGFNTSAIFGFCNALDEILHKENPSHIAVCFDPPGGSTFRHELYPDYKAQREKQPEDITLSLPFIKEILAAYRIPVVEVEGFEADDVIGTLSRRAEANGYITYMMTPDKDYGQLVTDRVLMYRPSLRGEGFEIRGPRQICERYGILSPLQVIDLLALEGDASDNIPGCPGVGEKTASKLIAEWGSIENLLDNTDRLKGALQRKIVDNAEQIRFSKRLVTIRTDVPLPPSVNIESMRRSEVDIDALLDVYRRLEFRSFIKRLTAERGAETQAKPAAPLPAARHPQASLFDFADGDTVATPAVAIASFTLANYPHDFTLCRSAADVAHAVEAATGSPEIGVMVNATGDEAMTARINGIAIATGNGRAFYIPISETGSGESLAMLSPLFVAAEAPRPVSADVKRDIVILRRLGIEMADYYFDTSLAHYLLEPEMKHDPRLLSVKYLDYEPTPPAAKGTEETPESDASRWCESADMLLRLSAPLRAEIDKANLSRLLHDIELPMARVLADMEWTGVRVDVGELHALSGRFTGRLNQMEEEAFRLAGIRFNIGSPMQVGEVLFDRLKLDPSAKRTKRGFYSTTEEILEKLRHSHPIVGLILDIRALKKLLTTYVNNLPSLVNPRTGKLHTTFNQTVTATGRISSTNPNLQNIPVRSDDGREIRRAFIPDPGDILMAADYSQIELRLMADMSSDPEMLEAFHSGADFHRATAAKIYHQPLDQVTDNQRRNAKTANFGIIYGISAFGLSERLGISRAEAKELIAGYFRTYPGVKEYMERSIETARTQGYVTTVEGRRRMLPDINSRNAVVRGYAERNAINAPLQGSAADIIKIAMVAIHRRMRDSRMQSRMILQVHDELVFNVVPAELDTLRRLVVEEMTAAYRGRVPMEVAVGTGYNWLEAH